MRQPDWAVLCSVPSSVRLASPQQCSPARNGRFARPCDTPLAPASRFGLRPQGICSTYTYMSSGRSPARLVSFSQVPPRSALRNCGFVPKPCFCGLSARPSASPLKTLRVFRRLSGGEASRAWHLWSSSARCSRSRPHSRSMRRRSRRLRGETRRNASSADTPPRLAPCLAAHPTNRVVACRSVRHSTPRPFLTFRYGAFLFVVFALADVPSTRLALDLPRDVFGGFVI